VLTFDDFTQTLFSEISDLKVITRMK